MEDKSLGKQNPTSGSISINARSGGTVLCVINVPKVYPKGIIVTDDELATIKLKPHHFHGEWNYTIKK